MIRIQGIDFNVILLSVGDTAQFNAMAFPDGEIFHSEPAPSLNRAITFYMRMSANQVLRVPPVVVSDINRMPQMRNTSIMTTRQLVGWEIRIHKNPHPSGIGAKWSVMAISPQPVAPPIKPLPAPPLQQLSRAKPRYSFPDVDLDKAAAPFVAPHNPCVCGAHKNKIKPFQVGHAGWCDVSHLKEKKS